MLNRPDSCWRRGGGGSWLHWVGEWEKAGVDVKIEHRNRTLTSCRALPNQDTHISNTVLFNKARFYLYIASQSNLAIAFIIKYNSLI